MYKSSCKKTSFNFYSLVNYPHKEYNIRDKSGYSITHLNYNISLLPIATEVKK